MSDVYVEARPIGLLEGSAVADYVVENRDGGILSVHPSESEAVDWSKQQGYQPYIVRVRHFNKKYNPDHWKIV